jgi:hypothetical protein
LQMKRTRIMLWLVLLVLLSAPDVSPAQSGASPSSGPVIVDAWVKENYPAILHELLPERLEMSPFPRGTKWVVVVLIEEPFAHSEYWISVWREYDGSTKAKVKTAHGGSLVRLIKELKQKNPDAPAETIAKMIRIDDYEITDRAIPQLARLASNLERMRISPLTPDLLMMDSPRYHYWTQSQYGQEMSAELVGSTPNAKRQPHPLVEWAEEVHTLVAGYVQRQHAQGATSNSSRQGALPLSSKGGTR